MHSYRIGQATVSIEGAEHPRFAHLRRCPDDADPELPRLTLHPTAEPIGPEAIVTGNDQYRKTLDAHETTIRFAERHVAIRYREPLDANTAYLVFRDIFCSLGGLCGDPLLHASAVTRDGAAHVFLAESGGGKSTIAAMLRAGATWINDEIVWTVGDGDAFAIVNQPLWRGDPTDDARDAVPIRALYLIGRGDRCVRTRATAAEAFPLALAAPFGPQDPLLPARADRTARLLAAVPVYRLTVPLDPDAVAREVFR